MTKKTILVTVDNNGEKFKHEFTNKTKLQKFLKQLRNMQEIITKHNEDLDVKYSDYSYYFRKNKKACRKNMKKLQLIKTNIVKVKIETV